MFLSTELDGKCCFARADDASMDAYLEIGYHMGADAQTLAGSLLNDYGTIASMETLGEVKLGSLTAYGVKGVTVQRELEAYLIPTANGCISVVLCHAGTAPASWYDSLLASAQTLPGKLPQRKLCQTAAAGYSSYGNQIGLALSLIHI